MGKPSTIRKVVFLGDYLPRKADDELLAVNDALDQLSKKHPVQAEVVKLRYFGGRTNEEVAQVLGVSVATVKNYWAFSRAWLLQEIKRH
jgi:RNA polymerase sigma factor (sigma-70 family)